MQKFLVLSILLSFIISGCATNEKIDPATPEGAFKIAEKLEKNSRFEEALLHYADIKNKHPYSRFATESELKIADIHYKRESFPEAESAYRLFKEFHPKHAKIDYVTFRLGMSYFKQLPDTIDRDLTLADKAMLYFDEIASSYPNSEYLDKALKNKTKTLKMLAGKENYIANFYFIRDKYDSALGRYEGLLKTYPRLGYDKKALFGAAISAFRIKDGEKARKYFQLLSSRFPKSKEKKQAEKELSRSI